MRFIIEWNWIWIILSRELKYDSGLSSKRPYSRKSCRSFVQVEEFRFGTFQPSKNEISRLNVKLNVRFLNVHESYFYSTPWWWISPKSKEVGNHCMQQSVFIHLTYFSSLPFIIFSMIITFSMKKIANNISFYSKSGIKILYRLRFCRFGFKICSHPVIDNSPPSWKSVFENHKLKCQ